MSTSEPQPNQVKLMNVQVGTLPGRNASIFSAAPMLGGSKATSSYYGRVVVEVWDTVETWTFVHVNPRYETSMLERARIALDNLDPQQIATYTPWLNEPAIGEQKGQTFQGRVVVEVYDHQVVVAVSDPKNTSNLLKRAMRRIHQES